MTEVEKRRADRLRVLKKVYDASGGSATRSVSGVSLLSIGLSDEDVADACSYLEGERLIKAIWAAWGYATPHVVQLTHRGISELERDTNARASAEVVKRRANRLRVLKAVYDASTGSTSAFVSGSDLLLDLGMSDEEVADACNYLEGEHLIKGMRTMWGHATPFVVRITHRGVDQMERDGETAPVVAAQIGTEDLIRLMQLTQQGIQEIKKALEAPRQPTEHFPPAANVSHLHVHGDIVNSPIQSASSGAHQEVSFGAINLGPVREFLRQFDASVADLGLPPIAADKLAAEVNTVKTEVESSNPRRHVLRESIASVRTILEITSGSMAAVGLLDALKLIHL